MYSQKNKLKPSLSDIRSSNEIEIVNDYDVLQRFSRIPMLNNMWFDGGERAIPDMIDYSIRQNKFNKSFPDDLSFDDFDSIIDFLEYEEENASDLIVSRFIYTDRELAEYIADQLREYRQSSRGYDYISVINDKDVEIAWRYRDGRIKY